MPFTTTINLGTILHLNPLSNATVRRATNSTFQRTCISACKPPSSASHSLSSQINSENDPSSALLTTVQPTASFTPSNISKAVSTAAKSNNEKDIEFNLPWAVQLAGAAFEAYAGVAVPGLVQKCPGGVEIHYTNQEFLAEKMAGILKVSIEEICLTSSLNKDLSSFVCKLSIGDSCLELDPSVPSSTTTATTTTANDVGDSANSSSATTTASNSRFLFVRNLERDRLSVRLLGKKSDEDAGAASLVVSDFVNTLKNEEEKSKNNQKKGEDIEISLELQDKELNPNGFIKLKLDFKPFSDVFIAEKASQGQLDLLGSPGTALMSEEWQKLSLQVLEASAAAFDPIAFIENHDTDTQIWLFINKSLKQLVVSFRGTVQDSWRDLLTDISMTPISLDPRHFIEAPRHANLAKLSAEPGTLDKVMNTVSHAKKGFDLKKQAARKAVDTAAAAASALQDDGGGGGGDSSSVVMKSREEEAGTDAEGLVSSAIDAVKTTAMDIQDFLARLRYLLDQGALDGTPSTVSSPTGGGGDVWVHSGFLTAYDSVRGALLGLIDTALANTSATSQEESKIAEGATDVRKCPKEEKDPNWTVLFTGHSLGGALATLAAFDLSYRSSSWSNKPAKIALYNFGSPRVGNKAFATEFNRAVPHSWRLIARNDAVVNVPRLVGYCHVGHAVIVGLDSESDDKKIEIQLHSSEAPFEGMAVVDEVLPAVGAAITNAVTRAVPAVIKGVGLEIAEVEKEADGEKKEEQGQRSIDAEQLAEYWEQEKEAWASLFQGSAISEHMEEFYYRGIEEAVDEWRRQQNSSSESR
jgi:hypothetical protein